MVSRRSLKTSLNALVEITNKTHKTDIAPIANAIWRKQLQYNNPLWKHVDAQAFMVQHKDGSTAHVMAMVDQRLPKLGLVGFFGATNVELGVEVLQQACEWLKNRHGIKDVYGPINGTITCSYRFNLDNDYAIPGEPVNPVWYVEVFKQAGFNVFNRYVSGVAKHAMLYIKFVTRKKPAKGYRHIILQPFAAENSAMAGKPSPNLKIYHQLMNDIFPLNSIYCPVISLEERAYNMAGSEHTFDPRYCFFAYDGKRPVGFIVAFAHNGNLVLKTVGLLPEYRGKKLSDLLVRRVHEQAKKDGLKSAVYSTIRTTTQVYKMKRPGVRVFRRYITMHKAI